MFRIITLNTDSYFFALGMCFFM